MFHHCIREPLYESSIEKTTDDSKDHQRQTRSLKRSDNSGYLQPSVARYARRSYRTVF